MISLLRSFCMAIDWCSKIAGYLASGLVPVLAFIVSFEVFCRYCLNRPTIWGFDLSLFLFGYISILGGAYAHQKKAHITVDILYKKVSPKTRKVFDIISFSLGIFFLVLIVWLSFDKLQDALKFGTRRESEWSPPMHHFWIMTISGCTLFALQLFRDIVANIYSLATGKELIHQERTTSDMMFQEEHNGN